MLNSMNIYRHFKGGYYIVHSLATVEADREGEQVVVYQSLQDGRVWTRPLSVFQEPVPEGKDNPTGQALRFERVNNFNNQLNLIPTETLVKELLSRGDCPVEIQTALDSDKLWRVQYLTGQYEQHYIDEDNTVEDFNIDLIHNTIDEAVSRVMKLNNPDMKIIKEVFIKQDFDYSPLV